MTARTYAVCILATRKDGPLYIGITNDLERRVAEHRSHAVRSHTAKYNIDRLVYVETFDDPLEAITREKALKKWRRAWKVALIEKANPAWSDLAGVVGASVVPRSRVCAAALHAAARTG